MREQHGPIMEDQSRSRFGNYDLIRPIDTGGMGEVYLAHQRSAFGRPVAIKIIRSDLVHDITARARFLREAEVSAHLKHEHILPLFEFGEDQGRLFLVTPYIEGGTLARRLQSGPLSLDEVRQLFVPLVQAIAYIHRRGVIHRDLKPTNILLDEQDGQIYVRLIDFGIATVQGRLASPPLTTAGNEVGTIAYMAPERLNGVAAPSNDIFSLGVMLHQMLTGNLPLGEEIDDIPKPMDYVVFRCMAMRPEDRFASADEVLQNFERAYQVLTGSPALPGRPSIPLDASMMSYMSGRLSVGPGEDSVSARNGQPVSVSLQHSGNLPVVSDPPMIPRAFAREDYNAPTTAFDPSVHQLQSQPQPQPASLPVAAPPRKPKPVKQRGGKSLLPLLSALMVVVILAIAGLGYYAFQTVTVSAATINFGPKVQQFNEVYTLTARPDAQNVDVKNMTIPVKGLNSSLSASQSGPTSGQVNCSFGVFNCQPGVSQDDVNGLVAQIQPGLEKQVRQDLQHKLGTAQGMQVTDINVQIVSAVSNPLVGQPGERVTVTLTERGSVGYIVTADAQSVARQALANKVHQFGVNYLLLSNTVRVGRPVVQSIDTTSQKVTIQIAAGGDGVYQFPSAELQAIKANLAGKTLSEARAFLANQPGVDPKTIAIRFTQGSGSTLPSDLQRITVVAVNASNFPAVQLQTVTTPTVTASPSGDGMPPTPTSGDGDGHGNGNGNGQ
ncbi:MAG: serine/threonine protein kinase [Chloroflexi bacterium]|nr:MAG: serine/threonine protein kinase [Chloroflexota bacterium]